MTDINNPSGADVPAEVWPEGDLPAQGGGFVPALMPGVYTFLLPATIAQLFKPVMMKDNREKLANGAPNPTYGQEVARYQLKFDKNNPLVVADGPHKGETFTATYSSAPKRRSKAGAEPEIWVSDLAYLLDTGFNDKSRPTTAEALKDKIIAHAKAGRTLRIDTGLSGQCRADKVRYVLAPNGQDVVQDPTGQKGCNDDRQPRKDNAKRKKGRFYTDDFKDPEKPGEFLDEVQCPDCGAIVRGFPQTERFLPPL